MADQETIRAFEALHGETLRERYGAHDLGVGSRRVDGVRVGELALVFYVESATSDAALSIPSSFDFRRDDGVTVEIPTTVVERAPAHEEEPG